MYVRACKVERNSESGKESFLFGDDVVACHVRCDEVAKDELCRSGSRMPDVLLSSDFTLLFHELFHELFLEGVCLVSRLCLSR
jgi:hypothetical protein